MEAGDSSTGIKIDADGGKSQDWDAFCEFLGGGPRSLSECTDSDAIKFLVSLRSDRIKAVVDNLKATFQGIFGARKENPFGSSIVRALLMDFEKENLFEIPLTTNDVGNGLVIVNNDSRKYFPSAVVVRGTDSLLRFEDEGEDKLWLFNYLDTSQSYILTDGWSSYIKEKQLGAGDFVYFRRHSTDSTRLFIGFRRRHIGEGDPEKLNEVENPLQLRSPGHNATEFDPILVISCGDNQDAEETYFISCILNQLCLHGYAPLRYDLTRSTVLGNQEPLYSSRVGIIIITINYACSREYLDGFVSIMDHLKANNLVLIPVFFKASLSDFTDQSGSFGRAFSLLGNSVPASQVLNWKAAMIELTSMKRYQYMKGDDGAVLAKNIVRDVCLLVHSEPNNSLKGMGLQLESILSLLHCSQSSAPQIVGLWGMAGIGKTTVAREIFKTQAERYDVCYFLPDFHLMCQTKGLSHLRDEFFSKIFGEGNILVDACDTKLSFSRDILLNKRVLIVLDGVTNARDVEDLVGGFGWFSDGHTIILTSRNRQVLVQCNAKELYKIQKLSEPESLQLCSQYATGHIWKGRMSLLSELVNYASGNPLALRVLGSFVQKQFIRNEKEHMRRLRQQPPIEIYEAFKKSFEGLNDNEKNTFLDLACFFKGENTDYVVNILDGCSFRTDLGICGLIDESLISLVDNRIEMPNIFQDTGRFVVCQEHKEVGKRSRLWDSDDIVDVLTKNSGSEEIEGVFLDGPGLSFELSSTVFERMYRLRLLKFHSPTSENHCKICLPQGLHSLPDELRLLHWERYTLGSLPRYFNPKNLVELNMPYSNMTKLWKGTKNLKNLKRIILSHSRQLTKFPRLSKAPNLEHIDLEGCTSLVKVNSSILHHDKLTYLSLKDCSQLRIMPTTVYLESLKVLNLSGCSELKDFQGFSRNLRELYLAGTAIREVPSSIRDLTKLVTFDLDLPPEVNNLNAVVTLGAKRPASSMDTKESCVENMEPPYKRWQLKGVIESVILNLRKRKYEKSVSRATDISEVQFGPASSSERFSDDPSPFFRYFFPEGAGKQECQIDTKTGDSYGNVSNFQHPRYRETCVPESSLSHAGLPLRPGKRLCESYFRTGNCKSGGPKCMYDHPTVVNTMASKKPRMKMLGITLTLGVST